MVQVWDGRRISRHLSILDKSEFIENKEQS